MATAAESMYNPAMLPQETVSPPPDVLVTGHHLQKTGYKVYRPHGSGNWLVTYTLGGRGLYRRPGVELRVEPGDLVLLAPGALHDYSVPPNGSWEFLWAHFHPRLEWLSWWRLPEVGSGLYRVSFRTRSARERARQAFLKLHSDARSSGEMQHSLALNGLEEVLLLAAREGGRSDRRIFDERVRQVLAIISEDLTASHGVPALAREVALSPSRLSHLFKQEVGDSVANTVQRLRLRQAARLLEYTVASVAAVSEDVGYGSPYYFSRQFRRHFGMSPSEYRAMVLGGAAIRGEGED